MERFAIKIDKNLRSNLYKICRLCGIDNPKKVEILDKSAINLEDGEPELWKKILDCIGFLVSKNDKMPQSICSLCLDKINDFHEFREMCMATNAQTRNLLGLKDAQKVIKKTTKNGDFKTILPPISNKRGGRKRKKVDSKIFESDIKDCLLDANEFKLDVSNLSNQKNRKKSINAITGSTVKQSKGKGIHDIDNNDIKEAIAYPNENFSDSIHQLIELAEPKSMTKSKLKCLICNEEFDNKLQLQRHAKTIHIPSTFHYYCAACQVNLRKNQIDTHHLWHKISKTPFKCERCNDCFMNKYTFSKHLRECLHAIETAATPLVLDRQCPQCRNTFETNFLYNIHSCSAKTKKCGGCSRFCKTKEDFYKHSSICPQTIINVSQHISVDVAKFDNTVRIKNENEVEAAAVSATNRSIGSVIHYDSAPAVMNEMHCVFIPRDSQLSPDDDKSSTSPAINLKRNKRVTKRDLKRFDELLKSTMTQLSTIKQEPSPLSHSPSLNHDSAIDNQQDDKDSDISEESPPDSFSIKQEIVDEGYEDHNNIEVNIKKEIIIDSSSQYTNDKSMIEQSQVESLTTDESLNRVPILKLKITMEDGKLNSSLIDDGTNKNASKKKKKKRKEEMQKEKKIKLFENRLSQDNELEPVESGNIKIKTEQVDENESINVSSYSPINCQLQEEGKEMHGNEQHSISSALQFSPIEFQISCVSGGVNMIGNYLNKIKIEEEDVSSYTEIGIEPTQQQQLELDVKPTQAELDSCLASNFITPTFINRNDRTDKNLSMMTKNPDMVTKQSREEFCIPQITSVFRSDLSNKSNFDERNKFNEFLKLEIKKEKIDPNYGDDEISIENTEHVTRNHSNYIREREYIANIDFRNVHIKEEIEITDEMLASYGDNLENHESSDSENEDEEEQEESEKEYREIEPFSTECDDQKNILVREKNIYDCTTKILNIPPVPKSSAKTEEQLEASENMDNREQMKAFETFVNDVIPQEENYLEKNNNVGLNSPVNCTAENDDRLPSPSFAQSNPMTSSLFGNFVNTNCHKSIGKESFEHWDSNKNHSAYDLVIEPSSVCSLATIVNSMQTDPFNNEIHQISPIQDKKAFLQSRRNSFTITNKKLHDNLNKETIMNNSCDNDHSKCQGEISAKAFFKEVDNFPDASEKLQSNDFPRLESIREYFGNINEIAENNNNINLERELQDENKICNLDAPPLLEAISIVPSENTKT